MLLRLIACLIVGAIITLAVSIACAVWTQLQYQESVTVYTRQRRPEPLQLAFLAQVFHGWPRTDTWPGSVPAGWPAIAQLPAYADGSSIAWRTTTWCTSEQHLTANPPPAATFVYTTTTFGWPARVLRLDEVGRRSGGAFASGIPLSNQGLKEGYPWPCLWDGLQRTVLIPRHPLIGGLLINIPFYALFAWLPIAAWQRWRGKRRTRRGECPNCSYPIGPGPLCPECGTPSPAVGA